MFRATSWSLNIEEVSAATASQPQKMMVIIIIIKNNNIIIIITRWPVQQLWFDITAAV